MISICVPTWNSLEYLKILVASIKKNTKVPYELLVHDNGSTDGTEKWLKEQNVKYTKSENNLGFCGVNSALKNAQYPYSMILNSDMYMLPGWDLAIVDQIEKFKKEGIDKFTISSSLLEPSLNNPEYVYAPFGNDFKNFNEFGLVIFYMQGARHKTIYKYDVCQYSHPILMPKFMIEEINYLDKSYFPGFSVDHDLAKCLYEKGCKNFVMLDKSKVYHFISATFKQLPDDTRRLHGQDIFFKKWKITIEEFRHQLNIKAPFIIQK